MQPVGTGLSVQSYTRGGPKPLLAPTAGSQRKRNLTKLDHVPMPMLSAPRTTTCATLCICTKKS